MIENLEERGEKLYDREGCRLKRREGRGDSLVCPQRSMATQLD
jgi:hypothetical protein